MHYSKSVADLQRSLNIATEPTTIRGQTAQEAVPDDGGRTYTDEPIIVHCLIPKSEINIRYDFDNHIMSSDSIYLMHISRRFRYAFTYYKYLRVTATTSVHGGFEALEDWSVSGRDRIPDMGDDGCHEI